MTTKFKHKAANAALCLLLTSLTAFALSGCGNKDAQTAEAGSGGGAAVQTSKTVPANAPPEAQKGAQASQAMGAEMQRRSRAAQGK